MKKDSNKSVLMYVSFFFLGVFLASGFMVMAGSPDSENYIFYYIVLVALAILTVFQFARCVLENFVVPRIAKKRAALRALGKDGVKIIRHDETARLAYKGVLSLLNEKYPQAEEYLHRALSLADVRQNQMFCIEWLTKLYQAMNNESKVLWCYRKAVEFAPDNPEHQSMLGHAYFVDGKLDQAVYCFEQALRYDPNNGYSYYILAKVALIRGENEKAYKILQSLSKINENHPLCHAVYAEYYAMTGNAEKAEEECKKSQLCGNNDPEELNKRINAMLSFHKTDYDGNDLPSSYYRRIEKPRSAKPVHSGGTGVIDND